MNVDCCTKDEDLTRLVNESIRRCCKYSSTYEGDSENLSDILACRNIKVANIHMDGLERTKKNHFNRRSIFNPVLRATNVQQLVEQSVTLREKLKSIGLFKDVALTIDSSSKQPLLPDYRCLDLVLDCKESSRVKANINAMAGSNELQGQTSLKLTNLTGRGESLAFGYAKSTANVGSYSLDFSKLVGHDFNTSLKLSLLRSHEPSYISKYDLKNTGVLAEISRPFNNWCHSLLYSGLWRNFHCPSWDAPFDVRTDSGHSLFSSLSYNLCYNSRRGAAVNSLIPGVRWESKLELAGKVLGGDHNFLKMESKLKKIVELSSWARLSLSLNGGSIVSLDRERPPSIVDRFFLGGSSNVRGFMMGGLGPHRNSCAYGGATYWTFGLSLFTRLPFRPGKGGFGDQFWLHSFANAGNLFEKFDFSSVNVFHNLGSNMRYTIGAGIHWRFLNFASIECNYCIPKASQPTDRTSPGFQLGISLEVL